MRLPLPSRVSTLDRIAVAYAEAVAIGDFDAAEGWLATAAFVVDREGARDLERWRREMRSAAPAPA